MLTPLALWNEGTTRQAILQFISGVTEVGGPNYVPPAERIAVFDNDGTLWCEKPMYIQFDFFLSRLVEQARKDPSLQVKQPWQAAWEVDFDWLGGAITKHYQGDDSDFTILLQGILRLAHNQPVQQVESAARQFIESQRHPTLGFPYRDCVYQPMLELLGFLENHGFTNYIVSGGGRDFMRGFSEDLYGIPRERVIGSTVAYRFQENEGGATIIQKAELDVVDDGPGKPIQIWNVIGRHPILAAGNSNGDIEMLKFAEAGNKPFLNLLVLHDDGEREFAYREGAEKALNIAKERNWQVVSMKTDWREAFSQALPK